MTLAADDREPDVGRQGPDEDIDPFVGRQTPDEEDPGAMLSRMRPQTHWIGTPVHDPSVFWRRSELTG